MPYQVPLRITKCGCVEPLYVVGILLYLYGRTNSSAIGCDPSHLESLSGLSGYCLVRLET